MSSVGHVKANRIKRMRSCARVWNVMLFTTYVGVKVSGV